jgi:hypothetical protein
VSNIWNSEKINLELPADLSRVLLDPNEILKKPDDSRRVKKISTKVLQDFKPIKAFKAILPIL